MRLEWLGGAAAIVGVAAIALAASSGTASAAACTTGTCTFTIDSTSFTPLNLGTGPGTGFESAATIPPVPGGGSLAGSNITTITFTPGLSPGDNASTSGLYSGNVANVATSPFGLGSNRNYLAAQPGGNVTINYTTTQTAFDLLWGSVDQGVPPGANYNLIMDGGTNTLNGATILAAAGGATGVQNLGVEISGLSFTQITLSDASGQPSAFEFVPGTPIPEPASLAILGAALTGFGVLRRRRKTT